MCDEWLEGPDVWSSKVRKARKEHKCYACRETIPVGARYRYSSGLWDGSWGDCKHCDGCWHVLDVLMRRSREPVDLGLDCGETWESVFDDPPPDSVVEAIFARPGEFGFRDRESLEVE
jgi:hypothetical protein